jgi:hypothetical protein
MDISKILVTFIIFLTFTSGCLVFSPSELLKTDDDHYLQCLEDYTSSEKTSFLQFRANTISAVDYLWDMQLNFASSQDCVTPLKVSSNLQPSKKSFLQSLTEGEEYTLLSQFPPTIDENNLTTGDTLLTKEKAKIVEDETRKHMENHLIFLLNTYDSNVCTAAGEKYSNIALVCKNIQSIKKD